jgi:hypothetical protein
MEKWNGGIMGSKSGFSDLFPLFHYSNIDEIVNRLSSRHCEEWSDEAI